MLNALSHAAIAAFEHAHVFVRAGLSALGFSDGF